MYTVEASFIELLAATPRHILSLLYIFIYHLLYSYLVSSLDYPSVHFNDFSHSSVCGPQQSYFCLTQW